jgi:hypothetical protein
MNFKGAESYLNTCQDLDLLVKQVLNDQITRKVEGFHISVTKLVKGVSWHVH